MYVWTRLVDEAREQKDTCTKEFKKATSDEITLAGFMLAIGFILHCIRTDPPKLNPTTTAKFCQMQKCESAASFAVNDVSPGPTYQVRWGNPISGLFSFV